MSFQQLKGSQIKEEALTGEHVKDGTLTYLDLAEDANISVNQLNNTELAGFVDGRIDKGVLSEIHINDEDAHGLGNGIVNSTNLQFGMNTIKHTGKVSVFPEIEFTGRHYVNLLGKDGDCEDISKWTAMNTSLSTKEKKFGLSALKSIASSSQAYAHREVPNVILGKYYLVSAWMFIESYSGGNIAIQITDMLTWDNVIYGFADKTKIGSWQRVALKLSGRDGIRVLFGQNVTNTSVSYTDGIMINEITADEYNNLSVDQLLAKYPYIESYGCLTNPYFENRRGNLVRNGNGEEGIDWWKHGLSSWNTNGSGGKFIWDGTQFVISKDATDSSYKAFHQVIPVKRNTDYYLTGGNANVTYYIYGNTTRTTLRGSINNITFNTGENDFISLAMYLASASTEAYHKEIMLIEGTDPPSEYKSCDIQRFAIEGQFTSDDKVVIKDGKVSGLKYWKHKILFGKDYDWKYSEDFSGFKRIVLDVVSNDNGVSNTETIIKYNGKILGRGMQADQAQFRMDYSYPLHVYVLDADSGWTETLNPNTDEVKAYMNGWKTTANDGTRYTAWVSVVDGITLPTFQTIDYVKTNIAPSYEGYRLHYKLNNPELITEDIVNGSLWSLDPGDNYINIDSGIVLKEIVDPTYSGLSSGYYHINIQNYTGINDSKLKYKTESIENVYKNNILEDMGYWAIKNDQYAYGKERRHIAASLFDTNAAYTVDYQIFKALHTQSFGSLDISYGQDVFSAIDGIAKMAEKANKTANNTITTLTTLEGQVDEHKADNVTDADGAHGLKIESGTWTPTLTSAGGGTPTYAQQNGSYIKTGGLVYIQGIIKLASLGTLATGAISISGLPFVVQGNVAADTPVADLGLLMNLSLGADQPIIKGRSSRSISRLDLYIQRASAVVALALSNILANTEIAFSMQYKA